jgi:drug/metabolite transporter (DMT)-like permease
MPAIIQLWWLFAILSGAGLAGRNVLMKTANQAVDPAMASMVLALSMAVSSVAFLIVNRLSRNEPVFVAPGSWSGVTMAAVAGISLAAANILLSFAYKSGGGAGLTGIMQNGVSLSLTLLIGVLLLNETIHPLQMAGIGFAVIGVFMIVRG